MLDALLGRRELKERIETLEAELAECREGRDRLRERYESADDRRREAVRERQTAQEERNRLSDRVEQLEDELERRGGDEDVAARGRLDLGRRDVARVLETLQSVRGGPEGLYTAMVEDGRPESIVEHLGVRVALVDRAAPCLCLLDGDGLLEVALEPPMAPAAFERWDDRFHLERGWFLPTEPVTVSLVRADLFAVGRFDGVDLVDVEGFTSGVKGRHSKGGFSQGRFERRREEQIDEHLDRCRDRLAAYDGPEGLLLTGAEAALDRLEVSAVARATVDATGDPEPALRSAFEEFWHTRVHRL